ncbi:MAG: methylated-DNA--[protein]-cysteine S-methyltransferase [Lachnoclostridium sp.]|nr:methylated-DNA--[protein]-cysteine S-methyltransferase [Lachnoclostridium sp.]
MKRTTFDLPIGYNGTEFQKSVLSELTKISYGVKCSYQEIADRIGRPKSVRAVANAIGANPLSILIPCHRVICSDNSIGGYAGGVKIKRYLLELEAQMG